MNRTLAITFAALLLANTSGQAQTAATQTPAAGGQTTSSPSTAPGKTTADDAQRLTTGSISKIDVKKKVLTVTAISDDSASRPATTQPRNSGRRGSGGGMGGGRRGGMGIPMPGGTGGGGNGSGRTTPPSSSSNAKPFKVTISDQTTIKDGDNSIGFGLLRIGDHISIQGLPTGKGTDMKASQITVNR